MKMILYILLLLTQVVYSQTRLDSLVLKELNSYRTSLNLQPVSFAKDCFNVSEKNTDSMLIVKNTIFHSENFIRAEVVNKVVVKIDINEKDVDSILSIEIIKSWKSSEKHNKILISPKYKFVGYSSKILRETKGFNGKMIKMYEVLSTMNFK